VCQAGSPSRNPTRRLSKWDSPQGASADRYAPKQDDRCRDTHSHRPGNACAKREKHKTQQFGHENHSKHRPQAELPPALSNVAIAGTVVHIRGCPCCHDSEILDCHSPQSPLASETKEEAKRLAPGRLTRVLAARSDRRLSRCPPPASCQGSPPACMICRPTWRHAAPTLFRVGRWVGRRLCWLLAKGTAEAFGPPIGIVWAEPGGTKVPAQAVRLHARFPHAQVCRTVP
jgi:hypothetical protein